MSKSESSERTPITFRVSMTENQRHAVKVIAAMRKLKDREFFEEAMEAHLDARNAAEKKGVEFEYERIPRDAVSMAIYADEGLAVMVDEWAVKDNTKKDDALYTAFVRHIETWTDKMGFGD